MYEKEEREKGRYGDAKSTRDLIERRERAAAVEYIYGYRRRRRLCHVALLMFTLEMELARCDYRETTTTTLFCRQSAFVRRPYSINHLIEPMSVSTEMDKHPDGFAHLSACLLSTPSPYCYRIVQRYRSTTEKERENVYLSLIESTPTINKSTAPQLIQSLSLFLWCWPNRFRIIAKIDLRPSNLAWKICFQVPISHSTRRDGISKVASSTRLFSH